MTEIKGIKGLSLGAMICNVALLVVLFYLAPSPGSSATDLITFSLTVFGVVMSILYALQLLLFRRKYFRHRPISSGARVIAHISRIIQVLFTLCLIILLSAALFYSYRNLRYSIKYHFDQLAIFTLILMIITLNMTVFFKGWRLLKMVRKNYIDEVMASFD